MIYTVPDYYKKFRCLAADCPDTCCAGWQIVIDDRHLKKYASCKGSFGNRLRNSVNFQEAVFHQYGKRCAFLNDENLCDMHIEAGVEMMCDTCRKYPRHIEVFENEREITLSMSCPAAARLILGQTQKAKWKHARDEKQDRAEESFDDFLYCALQDTRKVCIRILQDRSYSIHHRMAFVLALVNDVQNRINANRIFDIQNVCERYQREGAKEVLQKKFRKEKATDRMDLLNLLEEWEVLDQAWEKDTKAWKQLRSVESKSLFSLESFSAAAVEMEQMVIYYFFTYFCGAVYDGDALAKAKMAVASTLIWETICELEAAGKKQILTFQERLQIAIRYSRELEHSDQNLNQTEEMMNHRKEASLQQLLGYLQ